uniref:AAA family ATPase n=1 Tax=uncultured Allobacillus sp. TaxID=1638025 RepID=UPI0025964A54|nr:AAA family ATPase [uncultured Allobacillus sp.]
MQINKLEIVSFGKWNRKTIHLHEGMNIICGPNESGKTSVRMFVMYILFGLEKEVRERFISKLDGQLGGRIHLVHNGEEWTIERFLHRHRGQAVLYRGGERVTEDETKQFYKGMDSNLFASIFSFQARDLQAIREKKADEVGKVLFNLGLTGSDRIVTLENSLEKKAGELFKKSGRKPLLNVKINELKELLKKIDEVKADEEAHQSLKETLRDTEEELSAYEQEQKTVQEFVRHHEKLYSLKTQILSHQRLSEDLKSKSWIEGFPPDAKNKYDQYKSEELKFKEQKNMHLARIERLQSEKETLQNQSKQVEYPLPIDSIEKLVGESKQLEHTLTELDENVTKEYEQFNRYMNQIGLSYSPDEVIRIDSNDYTGEMWKDLAKEQEELTGKLADQKLKKRTYEEEVTELEELLNSITKKQLPREEKIELEQQRDALKANQSASEWKKQLEEEKKKQASELEASKQLFTKMTWGFPVVTGILLALFLVFLFEGNNSDWFIVAVVFSVGVVGGLVGFNQSKKTTTKLMQLQEDQSEALNQTDPEQLKNIELTLIEQDELSKKANQLETKLEYAKNNVKELVVEQDYLNHRMEQLEKKRDEEINRFPFLSATNISFWPSLYQTISQAKAIAESIKNLEEKKREQQAQLDENYRVAQSILALYDSNADERSVWEQLRNHLTCEKDNGKTLQRIHNDLLELQQELKDLHARFEPHADEWKTLLARTNSADEATFVHNITQHQEYMNKLEKREEAYEFVYQTFSEQTDKILRIDHTWDKIEEDLRIESMRLEEIRDTINELLNRRAELTAQIKQLEEDGELSDLIHQKSMLVEEIRRRSKEWATYRLAYSYLKETKDRYQNVYFPGIMKDTSDNFSVLTGNKYVEVQFSSESETINVCDRNGEWFQVGQLSEGTADQLYIALRLALSKALHASTALPFLLDDAFVNFDQQRKQHMFSLLEKQSSEHQIIYFTCEANDSNDKVEANRIELTAQERSQNGHVELLT